MASMPSMLPRYYFHLSGYFIPFGHPSFVPIKITCNAYTILFPENHLVGTGPVYGHDEL